MDDEPEKEVGEESEPKNQPQKTQNEDSNMQDIEEKANSVSEVQLNGELVPCSKQASLDAIVEGDSQPTKVGADLIGKETSKLQFLLAQPDIFEYLRKMNNDELLDKQEKANEDSQVPMVVDHEGNLNKRHANDGKIEDSADSKDGYESDNVIEKLEVQPSNLVFGELRAYQMDALNWLNSLHEAKLNGILADEMGLGKTIESMSIIALVESKKTEKEIKNRKRYHIVIVPKVTLNKWKKELRNWIPSMRVFVFYGDQFEKEAMKENELKAKDFD